MSSTRDTAVHATSGITIRRLTPHDDPALERLAQLDSATVEPGSRWLGAEVEGRLLAALRLDRKGWVADPFSRTGELLPLLETRAAQLGTRSTSRRRRLRPRAALRGSRPGAGGRLLSLRPY